ncbi:MAG: hypothetical protein HRU15_11185 [Planctomycetes bacterium]|nr:hypothetical protein [Planctomycetota bacterium]
MQQSHEAMLVLCVIPLLIALRNYMHGLALLDHSTVRMGVGGVMRVVFIWISCMIFYNTNTLNHVTAACALTSGFVAEVMVMFIAALFFPYRNK